MFRAITHQTPEGQENHMALRGAAVHEVQAKITEYTGFFATAQERRTWLASMPRNGFFADNYALMALVDVLRRPVLVWRTKAPSQVPTVFLPSSGISEERLLMPIYLLLNESKRGCEHYTALIPSAAPVRAVKQEVKREAAAAEAVQERRAESSAAPPLTVGQVWDLTTEDGKVFATPLLDLAKKEEELTPTEPDDEEEKLPATVPDEEEFEIRDERVFMKITTVLKAEAENLRSQQEPVLKRRRIRVKSAPPPGFIKDEDHAKAQPPKRRRLIGKKEDPMPVEESEPEAGAGVAWAAVPVLHDMAATDGVDDGEEETLVEPDRPPASVRPSTRGRKARPNELCRGTDKGPCIFGLRGRLGLPARCLHERCIVCMCTSMPEREQLSSDWKRELIKALLFFRNQKREDILREAFTRLPAVLLPHLKGLSDQADWLALLQQRVRLGTATPAQQTAFRQHTREDQRRVRKRFPALHAAVQEGDRTWQSQFCNEFRRWCKERSWQICAQCHRLCKRKLKEKHMGLRTCQATIKLCRHCKSGIGHRTVQKEDIPAPLQGLSKVAIDVLRLLHPWTGTHVRAQHGYRFHSDMIRFRWKPVAVEAAIRQLRGTSDQAPARAAYDYLMQSEQSSYKEWTEMHLRFLHKQGPLLTGNTEDPRLQLPRRVLESIGIECAVWPHLYPRTDMCETYIRPSSSPSVRMSGRSPTTSLSRMRCRRASDPPCTCPLQRRCTSRTSWWRRSRAF